ncbi:hypothetical protein VK792_05200 [Mesobacterium sp. TK19101]|uniref:Lipopolysaccharide export system protein LptC n=1 Tax=Mesobacterium hydrothermale TaxID=3111907 RepID=A0ABU6HDY4_9RHOB|nr:hypothetical protein [Mesobacterium sp. TK19101]MEC3860672.1 hypothetical protein [Mesobacterium sp. TK19101]
MARDSMHSRVIAWLKILLPLAALSLLSTVFLLSKPADRGTDIPFSDPGIHTRAEQQQITAPSFSGTTAKGDVLSFTADTARPDPDTDGIAYARNLSARINLIDGTTVFITADSAEINEPDNSALLIGGVELLSSNGYEVHTEKLRSSLDAVHAESLGPISGSGPAGTFTAGKMVLTDPEGDGNVQMLFTDGVKLVYVPED